MASDDSVLIGFDQPIAVRVQAMPEQPNRLVVECNEVFVDTEFAEMIAAAQKVRVVREEPLVSGYLDTSRPCVSCARRPDDTDAPSGVVTGPMAAGSAPMLPHLVRL